MSVNIFLVALALIGLAQGASFGQDTRIRYDNYSVYKVRFETKDQRDLLKQLAEDRANVSFVQQVHTYRNKIKILVQGLA